ncbi:MAG TPA: tetratricopeptide repeat protein [Planctomycetota bacterium]|nr:tetratricopeptide repeat protein [Planctomycetota bacterium]
MPAPQADTRFLAALAANRKGDKAGARAILEEILAAQPDHADSLEVLGMLVSETGELDRAIELTERVLVQRPDSIMAHANLSRFWMLKGDKATAEDWQAKARVLGWKDEIRRKSAAGGPGGASGGGPGGGVSSLERGPDPELVTSQEQNVVANPDDARARLALAGSYGKLGMHAKAVPHLQHALSVAPEMSIAFLELGKALEQVGAAERALAIYEQGIPIADRKGDFMPRNQMQSRLAALKKKAAGG